MAAYTQNTPNSNKFAPPNFLPVAVRAATTSGRFGSVYVLTAGGARLWGRSEPRRGRFEDQLIDARKGLLEADPLGALVRNAEATGGTATGQGRRAA